MSDTRPPDSDAITAAATAAITGLSFEEALKELEHIVGRLESGDEPLDKAIELYARGDELRRQCDARLNAAQARIEAIRTDADGRAVGTTAFAAG